MGLARIPEQVASKSFCPIIRFMETIIIDLRGIPLGLEMIALEGLGSMRPTVLPTTRPESRPFRYSHELKTVFPVLFTGRKHGRSVLRRIRSLAGEQVLEAPILESHFPRRMPPPTGRKRHQLYPHRSPG